MRICVITKIYKRVIIGTKVLKYPTAGNKTCCCDHNQQRVEFRFIYIYSIVFKTLCILFEPGQYTIIRIFKDLSNYLRQVDGELISKLSCNSILPLTKPHILTYYAYQKYVLFAPEAYSNVFSCQKEQVFSSSSAAASIFHFKAGSVCRFHRVIINM